MIFSVKLAWQQVGITLVDSPLKVSLAVDDLCATVGTWFYTPLPDIRCGSKEHQAEFYDPQVAYHGCSLPCAREVLCEGLKVGPNVTDSKEGVYCERRSRVHCAVQYASHIYVHNTSGMLAAAVFELCVDRANGVGMTANS